jgi:hypothetical protein
MIFNLLKMRSIQKPAILCNMLIINKLNFHINKVWTPSEIGEQEIKDFLIDKSLQEI